MNTVLQTLEAMHPSAGLSDMDLCVKTATLTFVLSPLQVVDALPHKFG